jgi:hypothetical protein
MRRRWLRVTRGTAERRWQVLIAALWRLTVAAG